MSDTQKPPKDSVSPAAEQTTSQKVDGEPGPGGSSVEVPPAPKGNGNTNEKEKNSRKWWKTVLASLPFWVSLFSLAISFLAYQNTGRSADATEESAAAAKRSADASGKTADAAQKNVATAQAALNAAIERDRLDQRAWVTVESIATHPAVPEVGQTYRISVNFRNSGKTPAKDIFASTVVDPVTMLGEPNFSYGSDRTVRVGMIAPNGTNFASLSPAKSRSTGKDAPLTPEVLADLKEDRLRFYVHGRVAYADIFGKCHWIIFCSYLLASDLSSFGICPDHNDTGDEECKDNQK